jgi:hypothetical protein
VADLRPPNDGVASQVWATKRIAQRGGRNAKPNIVDPDLIVVARYPPIPVGQDVPVCELAAPGSGNRMLVIEPSVKRPIQIGSWGRNRQARQRNKQECDEPKHAFGLLSRQVRTTFSSCESV